MEPNTILVDENGNDCSDIGPIGTLRGADEVSGAIPACEVDESSDEDSTSPATSVVGDATTEATDGVDTTDVVPITEQQKKEDAKEFPNRGDFCTLELQVATEAEEDNDNIDSSNSKASLIPDDDSQSSVNSALEKGNKLETVSVDGLELPESEGKTELQTELQVATRAGVETVVAVASPVPPTVGVNNANTIPYLVSTDSEIGTAVPTQEKAEVAHLPPQRKGLRFLSMNNKVDCEPTTTEPLSYHQHKKSTKSDLQRPFSMFISSLPNDSLHSIASFLTPIEWRNFGQCSKKTNKICREVFRRVRMHGFRCATEVVMAWKFGQHADAKELCALYVSAGVPIYPYSLGHSYHTLVWRLSIEAKHLQEQREQQQENSKTTSPTGTNTFGELSPLNAPSVAGRSPADPSAGITAPLDPFYSERDDFRMREELVDGMGEGDFTYLEEKSLYKLNAKEIESNGGYINIARSNWRRTSIDQAHRRARNPFPGGLPHPQGLPQVPRVPPPLPSDIAGSPIARSSWIPLGGTSFGSVRRLGLARSNSFSGNRYRPPKLSVKIHRHLLDQHLLGRSGVNDFDGSMTTPQVSLSADFFHPFFSYRPSEETTRYQSSAAQNSGSTAAIDGLLPAYHQLPDIQNHDNNENAGEPGNPNLTDDSDSDGEAEMVFPRPLVMEPPHLDNVDEMMAAGATFQPPSMIPPNPPTASLHYNLRQTFASRHMVPHQVTAHNEILSNIDLDVYSASSKSKKSENDDTAARQLSKYLKARFTVYHCCLERHLLHNDSDNFEETIMDFWDEFFPQTANIQYYDRNTAVPRISRLESFLTKPCPKQIGIVQCEIERVKLSSKKKGVNVKGRFFPTYEYRLFIRHRPSESAFDFVEPSGNNKNGRRDTVLMMAKNRGRKYPDNGQASKKGSNNYYLSLPQQDDLDLHYKSANGLDDPLQRSPNGAGTQSASSEFSGLLGRLQSNFVGTEFQIFTPRPIMKESKSEFFPASPLSTSSTHSIGPGVISDDDMMYDNRRRSEMSPMSSASPRKRFGRLSLRRSNGNNGDVRTEFSEQVQPRPSPLNLRRSRSSDSTPRRNRKVSAAESFFESPHFKAETQRTFYEEEDGAITYTANLLGSRPRIMDVCIPKVNPSGAGTEWRRYLESCKDQDACASADRLLDHLKQMQQNSQMEEHGRLVNPANNDPDTLGNNEQDYSPPNDYGLLALQNRPPWWNVELGSFVLNFGGRVSVASVKNFQLCDRNDQDHIMLQFGRIEGRHSFTMDFQYPLTAVQAFAIAISSLQSKISFG